MLSKWECNSITVLDDFSTLTDGQYIIPEVGIVIINSNPFWQSGELG